MYRGRPPHRGGYPPPFEGRGPPFGHASGRAYSPPSYREERGRPRSPYHQHGYHDRGPPSDSYRRSPPRRRYPSPGPGSHRGGEYWGSGPPRERSSSPRGRHPIDHNLVITVGNELTGKGGPPSSRHLVSPDDRPRGRSRTPDRNRAKSRGRSKSRARSRSKSRARSRSKSRARSRSKSRARSRSHSLSPERGRARSKSRGRSKSRVRSKSRSRSHSRSRSRGRSTGRAVSRGRSRSRVRRSWSRSRSSSGNSMDSNRTKKQFQELELARRRKEMEELLNRPTKSILKKRLGSEDSASRMSSDSPSGQEGGNISQVAQRLLSAVKGVEPEALASILSELKADPQLAQRVGLDPEMAGILHLLGVHPGGGRAGRPDKPKDDIEDEEEFLYGDSDDTKPSGPPEAGRGGPQQHAYSDLYGDLSEEALYGEPQPYTHPPPASLPLAQGRSALSDSTAAPPAAGEGAAEYQRIQGLLKTIGLDLGVTEISKMAARTKERLHGNKPPPKTPTRRQRYSSGSSERSGESGRSRRRRGGGSSSSSGSSDSSRSRASSWSSEDDDAAAGRRRRKPSPPAAAAKPRAVKQLKSERGSWEDERQTPPAPEPGPVATPPAVPPYGQAHGMAPPQNYPPHAYAQYGNYMPYMPQQWPPMYPPGMPQDYPGAPPYERPFNTLVQPDLASLKRLEKERERSKILSEEKNNESQKQKVLEEREKLLQEREIRMKKKECLMKELESLRKQQGELLRKKRREKDGHKDPLLCEISGLQESVMRQISELRLEHEAAERKRTEIDKVALILGLDPSDRPRRAPAGDKMSPEGGLADKQSAAARSAPSQDTPPTAGSSPSKASEKFEYFDPGQHWCKNCNVTTGSMFVYFTHLQGKGHRKTQDPYDRPWAPPLSKTVNIPSGEKITKPAKGSEFLLPVRGFYCRLCKEFYGDAICAEEHVTTHAHNEKYKLYMMDKPLYEQRRNLEQQAGLTLDSGKKRKHMEGPGDHGKEEKSKHKKEKKDKEQKRGEEGKKDEKFKPKKEEVEDKFKSSSKVEAPRKVEEEKAALGKMVEDEKHRSMKDDRQRYSREENDNDGPKYGKRDEVEKYKHCREDDYRYRYRQDEDRSRPSRGEERPRYDDDRYRPNKYPEPRSKHDREREEPKPKIEKETKSVKRQFKEEAEVKKPEPPPKPYDPPKVMCGPSPAMRAKLRKQSLESAKAAAATAPAAAPAAPAAPAPPAAAFGRFTWKKKENVLAKEAEQVAAEFLKDDEAPPPAAKIPVEDSFAKSMAVAKEIALKLSGQPPVPPPWAGQVATRGRIRPNLPAPAIGLRTTAMVSKPAPLNAFLSIRPQSPESAGPEDNPLASEPVPMEIDNQDEPVQEPVQEPAPMPVHMPAHVPVHVPVQMPAQMPVRIPVQMPVRIPVQMPVEPPPQFQPPSMSGNQRLVAVESDEAAPGVPVSEQTRTVFVKPPPFMNSGDGAHRSEKLKTHLAAAKAKDLFDIFYSGVSQSGPSAFPKPAADTRAPTSGTKTSGDKGKPSQPVPQSIPKPVPPPSVLLRTTAQVPAKPQTTPDQSRVKQLTEPAQSEPPPCQTHKPIQSKQGPPVDTAELKPALHPPVKPEPQTQPDLKPEAPPCVQPVKKSQPDPVPEVQPVPQTQPDLISPAQSQVQPVKKSQPDPVPEVQPVPETQPDLISPAQSQVQPVKKSQPDPIPEVQPVPQTQTDPAPQTKPHVPPVFQVQVQSEPIPQTQSQVQTIQQTQPEPQTLLASETKVDPPQVGQVDPPQVGQVDPPQVGQVDPLPCLHGQDEDLALTTAAPTQSESPKTPKTKVRTSPQAKKTSPASRPVRQTRSQTRYQTRRQRSQCDSGSESGLENEEAAFNPDGPETGPSLEPQVDETLLTGDVPPNPEIPDIITPETLGLPSDMMSLGFEYDFNFE